MLERLSAWLPGGAQYDLLNTRVQKTELSFSANQFQRIGSSDIFEQSLRLQHNGRLVSRKTSLPHQEEALLKGAIPLLAYGAQREVPVAEANHIADLDLVDDRSFSSQEMIEYAQSIVTEMRALNSGLAIDATLNHQIIQTGLLSSNGFDHSYKRSLWYCRLVSYLTSGRQVFRSVSRLQARGPEFDSHRITEGLRWQLENTRRTARIKNGHYPILFTPRCTIQVIVPLIIALQGSYIADGTSPWADRIGEQMLDKRIYLNDDGSLPRTCGSLPFDSEGSPTRRNELIVAGRPNQLLLDRHSARQLDMIPSGNAGPDGIRVNHLFMQPGDQSFTELVRSVDEGIIVLDAMNMWSQNPLSGIISGTVSLGMKIERGEIVGRVQDCTFQINVFQHFRDHLIGLSSEVQSLEYFIVPHAQYDVPHVLLDAASIATT